MATFNILPDKTNRLIEKRNIYEPETHIEELFHDFLERHATFPSTAGMAGEARECVMQAYRLSENRINREADKWLLKWIETECKLFKALEIKIYGDKLKSSFNDMDDLIGFSNTMLNRRKSGAGKSLEHHLAQIFTNAGLRFETQEMTEGKKKPDFLFP